MPRIRARPAPPLDSPRVESTTIGLRPIDHLAARYLAKRRRRSVSNLFQDLLREEIEREEGRHWEQRLPDLATQEGIAA